MNKQIKTKFEIFRKATSELVEAVLDCEEIEMHNKAAFAVIVNELGEYVEGYLKRRDIL